MAVGWRRGSTWAEKDLKMDKNDIEGDPVIGLSFDPGATGTAVVRMNIDGTITFIGEYTLTATDGTAGQALITDGAGNVDFDDISVASSGSTFELVASGNVVGDDGNWRFKIDGDGNLLTEKKESGSWNEKEASI